MTDRSSPEMSVVLVTPERYANVRKTVKHLREQTVSHRLEIIIVAPSAHELALDESDLQGFLQWCVVEVGAIKSTGRAIAAGVRLATAPVVVYAEEHSYPEPGWAEALIKAHRQPWAAVGPVIANANPDSMTSWAHLLTSFGPFVELDAAGLADRLPTHSSAYKSVLLSGYGSELETMLEAEIVLHRDLRARGYQLYLEPAAKIRHVNVSLLSSFIRVQFHGGRLFMAARVGHGRWSVFRRLAYIGGAPLIQLVRLGRILRDIRRSGRQHDLLPGILPSLLLGLIADGVGKMVGTAYGPGDASQQLCSFELYRYRHLSKQDR